MPTSSSIRKSAKKSAAKKKAAKKAPAKPPEDVLIDAVVELTEMLKNAEKCSQRPAYFALPKHHRQVFDELTKAISIRAFGE